MIERIHLSIVHAVEQHGTLTAAAKELCVTQSGHCLLSIAKSVLPLLDHAEDKLKQITLGERGTLRIGMECHPCYQWLLKVISPFLDAWLDVDVDVKQKFQFGGISALLDYEIDLLVTPDPLYKSGLNFEPVFDYEQILVVAKHHALASLPYIQAEDLQNQILLTYPVANDRLDIYTQFLNPAGIVPRLHKTIETTEIMLQMVACDRGVAPLPRWLAEEYCAKLPLSVVHLSEAGITKQIFLGTRDSDHNIEYLKAFTDLAYNYKPTSNTPP